MNALAVAAQAFSTGGQAPIRQVAATVSIRGERLTADWEIFTAICRR